MTLPDRLRSSLAYLDAQVPAQLLTPGVEQPSVGAAAQELKRCAQLLALLALNNETPQWDTDAGRKLEHRVAAAADGLAVLCAAQAQEGCPLATRDALLCGGRAAVNAAATVAQLAARHAVAADNSGGADAALRQQLVRATAAAEQACEQLASARTHPCVATARALVHAGAAVKHAAQEAKSMVATPSSGESAPACAAGAAEEDVVGGGGGEDDDDDSCGFTEAATPQEAAVITIAVPLLDACLAVLQPVVRCLADRQKGAPGTQSGAAALDALLTTYRDLAAHVDAFTAALWPPQEQHLLREHCCGMGDAAARLPDHLAALCDDGTGEHHVAALRAACDVVRVSAAACLIALDATV